MTTLPAHLGSTGQALLTLRQSSARTADSPASLAATGVAVSGGHSKGHSFAAMIDATGHVTMQQPHEKGHKTEDSAGASLFG
ncbi:hypothetical protein LOC54_00150 [Acetobacter sp. AN02]|uniref:hypothetical protein n=1 Tax=Acetobacter sp. AN02 TaxID=2894186 RepID=UPI0024341C40|nr:hypothetical protein [Acetobacter sp. AN02]MDG6093537.1 hypothetical protein [Acetobacter sp. AN02]